MSFEFPHTSQHSPLDSKARDTNGNDYAIRVSNLNKCYQIYENPQDRLKQSILPRIRSSLNMHPKQYFEEFWALKNISFDIKKGQAVGIIGRNGSGKSTLLQIICGTLSPTSGTVETNGRIAALLELGAGFNLEFTGRDNVYMYATILGFSKEQIDVKFDDIASFADIGNYINHPVKTYSSGMFARLAFSVAIHVDPTIFVVDEALAVGDTAFQKKCMRKFYEIRDKGSTILFVSHDSYQIRSICSRALYLEEGKQVMFSEADKVMEYYSYDIEKKQPEQNSDSNTASNDREKSVDHSIRISSVRLENINSQEIKESLTGETVQIRMRYLSTLNPIEKISFVVNLYRHDDLYICGSTTIMDGVKPKTPEAEGEILIKFHELSLLSGKYKWRVAINDEQGLGILAEAAPVCEFSIKDEFEAVGLINLTREWITDDFALKKANSGKQ